MGCRAPRLYAALLLAALVVGGAEVFRDNAAQTMLPALVPQDRLERANGQLVERGTADQRADRPGAGGGADRALAAPGLRGERGGLRGGDAAGGGAGRAVPGRAHRPGAAGGPRLRRGVAFLRGVPLLRTLAWTTGFWNLFAPDDRDRLVVCMRRKTWGCPPQVYGLTLAGGAVGGIAGSLLGERIARRAGPGADDAVDAGGVRPLLCRDGAGAGCR